MCRELEALHCAGRPEGRSVDAVLRARGPDHLLALEPLGGERVLLDRHRVVPETHDERAGLGRESGG